MGPEAEPPKTASELRFRLLGAWKLESYMSLPMSPNSPSRPTYPMTKNVQGMIMYTSDGYMSAQLWIPGQLAFSPDRGTESQWAETGKRYFGYCGPYYVSEEDNKVRLRHGFRISSRPDLVKEIQIRAWRFEDEGKLLILSSEEPAEVKVRSQQGHTYVENYAEVVQGELRMPELRWRQMPNNIAGTPPENMR